MILLACLSAPTKHAFGLDNACQQQVPLPVLFLGRVTLTKRYWVILAKRRSGGCGSTGWNRQAAYASGPIQAVKSGANCSGSSHTH
jgi:hypothetical protein